MFLAFNAGDTIARFLTLIIDFFKRIFLLLREINFLDFNGNYITFGGIIFSSILITACCAIFYKGGRG